MALKIVFAGTPEFAIPTLQALMASNHEVLAVYTKPDSPSGRGLKLTYSPVKQFVVNHYPNLPIIQPTNLKDSDTQKQLSEFYADLMVVIAYGIILPKAVLSFFKYGCINVHASLLPRWRGAAPIQRALLAGDQTTGVTIMQIDEGLDTGQMLHIKEYQIQAKDTAQEVHDNLASLGAEALIETLALIENNALQPKCQDNKLATYAAKIVKEEALINWHESAVTIERHIRAFNPWPIAYTYLSGELLKVWDAEVIPGEASQHLSGQVVATSNKGIDIATKQGILRLLTVQLAGGKPMATRQFLNSRANLIVPHKTVLGDKLVSNTGS